MEFKKLIQKENYTMKKSIKYDKNLNCEIETHIKDDVFQKIYYGLSREHWDRILTASAILAKADISPEIIKVENEGEDFRRIEYKKITAFNNYKPPKELSNYDINDIIENITEVVEILDNLWLGHGDLHIFNLGVDNGKIYLLDLDTIYELRDLQELSKHHWLKNWIIERFDGDFDYFIKSYYDIWRTDWLN